MRCLEPARGKVANVPEYSPESIDRTPTGLQNGVYRAWNGFYRTQKKMKKPRYRIIIIMTFFGNFMVNQSGNQSITQSLDQLNNQFIMPHGSRLMADSPWLKAHGS